MKHAKPWILLLVFAVLLSACGSNSNTESSASPKTDKKEAAKVDPFRLPQPVEASIVMGADPSAKLPTGDTVDNSQVTRYFADKTNVKFKLLWNAAGKDFDQKLKLAIASDDLPDLMQVDEKTFRSLADAGQIQDMTEIYNKYASPLMKDLYTAANNKPLEKATIQGKLMAIPNIVVQADAVSLLWVRQDWLDKLGLPAPKTLDDVATISKTFIEKDPGGKGNIGFAVNPDDPFEGFKGVFAAYHSYPEAWLKDSSGNLVYGTTLGETKQALGKVQQWYKAGLIDKEFAMRKDWGQSIADGKSGLFFHPWWGPWWPLADSVKNDPKANWKAYWIPDANGKYSSLMRPVSDEFLVVRKGFEHPEAAMVYINAFVNFERGKDPEGLKKIDKTIQASYFPLYSNYDYADAVQRKHDALQKVIDGKSKPDELTPEMQDVYDHYLKDKANPKSDVGNWNAPYAYLEGGGALEHPYDQVFSQYTGSTPAMDLKGANLKKLETEMFYKIVVNGESLDTFDSFVKDWKAQGGDEITKQIEAVLKK